MKDLQTTLKGLEDVAERAGLEVRYESMGSEDLGGRSARCRLKGREILFIDRSLAPSDRIDILIQELNQMNLTGIYMKPYLRALLQACPGEDP